MLKRVIPFPLLMLSAALAGCGGASTEPTETSSSEGAGPSEIASGDRPAASAPRNKPAQVTAATGEKTDVTAALLPLVAKDDYFVVRDGANGSLSVSSNDEYSAESTNFEVVEYPAEGEIVMDPDGAFIYHANGEFVGEDVFVYQASDGVSTMTATARIEVEPQTDVAGLGFTPVVPAAGSKVIYVSSSLGNDENDCETPAAPCQSLEAALSKTRAGEADHVYLKRGDVWRDEKLAGLKSGRSAAEPAVVSSYGSSNERPKIEHSDTIISLTGGDKTVSHLHIIGLNFDAYRLDVDGVDFSGATEDHANLVFLGGNHNVLLEDNVFNHIEIVVQQFENKVPKDFSFRRNIWTGAYGDTSSYSQKKRPSNIYADGVDGLSIEENVFDYGGWNPEADGAAGNMYNHNLYLQSTNNGDRVTLKNNIITRASSHGAQMRAGGLAEDNFFGRNAIGLLVGYDKKPLKNGVKAHAIDNVITEGASMVKGAEPCSGENLCTPAQWGLDFVVNGNADWLAEGNIVHSLDRSDETWKQEYDSLVTRAFNGLDDPAVVANNNLQSSWGDTTLEGVDELDQPGRTLGDYYVKLLSSGELTAEVDGEDNFDRFMNVVKSRGPQQWDEKLTAKAINAYIREGFEQ